jgi:hypothetical protein
LIVGVLGAGKTYCAVHDALADLSAGRRIVSNFKIQPPEVWEWGRRRCTRSELPPVESIESWEQFLELEDCHCVLDEAQLWAPSYDPKALSGPVRYKLSHMRKDGMRLSLVTQHEERAARMLRDLCTDLIRMQASGVLRRSFTARHYEPEDARRKGAAPLAKRRLRFDPLVAGSYRTLEAAGFPALVDPFEVGVVEELARRRNAGEPLAGTLAAVWSELESCDTARSVRWSAIGAEVKAAKAARLGSVPRGLSKARIGLATGGINGSVVGS